MKERYILILLLFFIIFYNSQGVIYPKGSAISQLSLIIILGISGLYFIKTLLFNFKKDLFYKSWTALLLLNVFGFIFTGNISDPIHYAMIKGILISLLIFYPFYYFSSRQILLSKDLIIFFIILIPITVAQFYLKEQEILLSRTINNVNVVNNTAYDFVWLMPFAFLIKNKKVISVVTMIILMFFIIQGAKRGAIVTGGIGILFYIYYQLRTISRKNRIRGYIGSFIGLIGMGYYAYSFFIQNEYLIERLQQMEEGVVSGRDIIYANLLNAWYNSDSYIELILGYGFAVSVKLSGTGNVAHNDWLELLSNFGLLGVSIYLVLFYSGVKKIFVSDWDKNKRIVMGVVMTMWFLITLFSMGYTIDGGYLKAILLGYLIVEKNKI